MSKRIENEFYELCHENKISHQDVTKGDMQSVIDLWYEGGIISTKSHDYMIENWGGLSEDTESDESTESNEATEPSTVFIDFNRFAESHTVTLNNVTIKECLLAVQSLTRHIETKTGMSLDALTVLALKFQSSPNDS